MIVPPVATTPGHQSTPTNVGTHSVPSVGGSSDIDSIDCTEAVGGGAVHDADSVDCDPDSLIASGGLGAVPPIACAGDCDDVSHIAPSGFGAVPSTVCVDDIDEDGEYPNGVVASSKSFAVDGDCVTSGDIATTGLPADFSLDSATEVQVGAVSLSAVEEDTARFLLEEAIEIAGKLPASSARLNELSDEERRQVASNFTLLRGLLQMPHAQGSER